MTGHSAREFVVTMPCVELAFTSHVSTGTDQQTGPGMGVRARVQYDPDDEFHKRVSKRDGWTEIPMGVVPRDHLQRLIEFMQDFLTQYPKPHQ